MTVQDTRTTSIPQPRPAADDSPAENSVEGPAEPAREFPWPEPWHANRGARPRSEYWDAATASWHSRGPVVPPRTQD